MEDGRVGHVDTAAGTFPHETEAVAWGALDEEHAVVVAVAVVLFVQDEGAHNEVGEVRVDGEVLGWGGGGVRCEGRVGAGDGGGGGVGDGVRC